MNVRFEPCRNCGTPRDPDLKIPCDVCGSQYYPIIGYSYAHEAKMILGFFLVLGIILLAAIVIGVIVFAGMIKSINANIPFWIFA